MRWPKRAVTARTLTGAAFAPPVAFRIARRFAVPFAIPAVILFAALVAACSAPAPPPELLRAERLERSGRDAEALAAYEAAARRCEKESRRTRRERFCAAARLGRAATLERLGRIDDAAGAYQAIAADPALPDEARAGALVAAGTLLSEHGQERRGWILLWAAITRLPETSAADEALRVVLRDGRRRAPRQLYDVVSALYGRLYATALGDDLLAAAADLAQAELRDPRTARALWDRLAAEHRESPHRDDALWRGARLSEELGDPRGAEARYRALLSTRERSFVVGSYHSVWLDDAQLALGRLLRDRLGDPVGAARVLAQLGDRFPDSVLRDDALYELALAWERAGHVRRACAALARLKAAFPESRYEIEAAPALRSRLRCVS